MGHLTVELSCGPPATTARHTPNDATGASSVPPPAALRSRSRLATRRAGRLLKRLVSCQKENVSALRRIDVIVGTPRRVPRGSARCPARSAIQDGNDHHEDDQPSNHWKPDLNDYLEDIHWKWRRRLMMPDDLSLTAGGERMKLSCGPPRRRPATPGMIRPRRALCRRRRRCEQTTPRHATGGLATGAIG